MESTGDGKWAYPVAVFLAPFCFLSFSRCMREFANSLRAVGARCYPLFRQPNRSCTPHSASGCV